MPLETVPAEQPEPARPEEAAEAVVSSAIRAYEMLLEERQKELDTKDLWLHRLFILCCILADVIIAVLTFDLLNPSIGFSAPDPHCQALIFKKIRFLLIHF